MPSHSLMQRIMATRALKLKDGRLRIWGIPAAIYSFFTISYLTRLLEKGYSGPDVFYWAGYHQSKAATHTMVKRFGYKKKIIEAVAAHSTMLGLGTIDPVVVDLKKRLFVFRRRSELALEYLKEYGRKGKPLCHFYRGQCAGTLDGLFNDGKFLVIEKKCIAKGDKICEIIAKPIDKWDLTDPSVREQIPKKLPAPEDLGYKRSSHELPQRET